MIVSPIAIGANLETSISCANSDDSAFQTNDPIWFDFFNCALIRLLVFKIDNLFVDEDTTQRRLEVFVKLYLLLLLGDVDFVL